MQSPPEPSGATSEMTPAELAGAQLRQVREARGETLSDVAQVLKLSRRQVEALENGRYDALPGPAFARGFLRNYARYLGLDPAPLMGGVEQRASSGTVELSPVSNATGEMPVGAGRRNSSKPVTVLFFVLLAVVLAGWYFDWFQTEPPEDVTAASDAAEVAPIEGGVATEPLEAPVAEAPQAAAPGSAQPLTSAAPQAPAMAPVQGAGVAAPTAATPAAAPTTPAAQTSAASDAGSLVFSFTGESWLEVRDAAGAVVYSGTNTAGATRTVQGKAPFALVVGNAKDVRLEYQGKAVDLVPHTRVTVARLTVQ
jgi:cytoskeleton protein RodZ